MQFVPRSDLRMKDLIIYMNKTAKNITSKETFFQQNSRNKSDSIILSLQGWSVGFKAVIYYGLMFDFSISFWFGAQKHASVLILCVQQVEENPESIVAASLLVLKRCF